MSLNTEDQSMHMAMEHSFLANGLKVTGTIFIAEDDAATRTTITRHLEHDDHTVVSAGDGVQALEMIRESPPDLILLDIYMPGMDGRRVLESIRADEKLRHLPVIVITTDHEFSTIVECISLGADDYLVKPPNAVLLRARIKALLERKFLWDYEMALHAQLQRSYEQLSTLNASMDELTHMVVHDLRISLASLLSGLMTLKHFGGMGAVQQEIVDIGIQDGRTLLGMINDLQDIKQVEEETLHLKREPQAPKAMVNNVLQQMAALVGSRKQHLAADVEPDLPVFIADGEKVFRALMNLLGLVCKFAPAGDTVTVSIRRFMRESALLFTIENAGGKSEAEGENAGAGRPLPSTGLGLTFASKIVELHGGRLWLDTEREHGNLVSFILPINQAPG
ncbi:MAG: hybrid sensor histidine kinase/response regulator [Armatimonadota bacterium]